MIRILIKMIVPVLLDGLRVPREYTRVSALVLMAIFTGLFCLTRLILRLEPEVDSIDPWIVNIIYAIGLCISFGIGTYILYGRRWRTEKHPLPPTHRFVYGFAHGFNSQADLRRSLDKREPTRPHFQSSMRTSRGYLTDERGDHV